MTGQLLNIAFMLVLTIGFFIGLMFLVKYLKNLSPRMGSAIQILGGASISHKAKVIIVQSEGTKMLLGVTDNNISKLHEFPKESFESTLSHAQEDISCQDS